MSSLNPIPEFQYGPIVGYRRNAEKLLGIGDLRADAWGIQKVSLPYSIFHGMWTFDIPESMWFMYHNGTQVYSSSNITSVGGMARVATGGGVTSALLESRECPRYQPNRGHLFSTALLAPNPTANAIREWGVGTEQNCVCFRLKGDGKLYAVRISGGILKDEEEIDTSAIKGFDVSKNNIYDIQFQWRSAGNYKFYIGNPETGASQLVHKLCNLGQLTEASIQDPAVPIRFLVVSNSEVSMDVGCADVTSENGSQEPLQYESADISNRAVNGTNAPVMAIHSPLTVGATGRINTRSITLARISVTCDKRAVFRVWSTRNPAAFTGATFRDVNQGSFIKTDSPDSAVGAVSATAVNTALMNRITTIPTQALQSREVDNPYPQGIVFPVVRGDYVVVTCTATSANADCVIEWGEAI